MTRRRLAPPAPKAGRAKLGPRSNLVLTEDQATRTAALVSASAALYGEPMAATFILRAAVSIGLAELERRGLSAAGDAARKRAG